MMSTAIATFTEGLTGNQKIIFALIVGVVVLRGLHIITNKGYRFAGKGYELSPHIPAQ